MKKGILLLIIQIFLIFLLGGCWSRRELSEIAITSAIGIDKVEDKYLVTAQILIPSEIASQEKTSRVEVTTYRVLGTTIFEALRKLSLESPREIYLSHIRILVFGEDIAREGIGRTLDFISRDHEIRTDFYILVAKEARATELLNILTPIERIPASKIFNSMEKGEARWGSVHGVHLDEFITSLINEGQNPVLTGVNIRGDVETGNDLNNVEKVDTSTIVEIDNIAGFKGDKLVGWLNTDESRGYNLIMNNIVNSVLNIPCKEKKQIALEITRVRTKIKGVIENDKPKISIELEKEANVEDTECNIDLSKIESISVVEKTLEEVTEELMEATIKKAQKELKSDIFGFGEVFHRQHPKEWKNLKDNWDEIFEDLEVEITVEAKIRRVGTIVESFQKEIKE